MTKHFTLTALAIACASHSYADTASQTNTNPALEEIIVSSSRVAMPMRQVATSVSVISAEEIQQLGFLSVADVLRTQPGVAVSNTGGAGKPTTLRIRGEEGYRTLVMMDGIDISDTTIPQASANFAHILSSGVQRVEILRGPQGLMYGADAGGVVNITTDNTRDGLGGELHAEGGKYGSQLLAATLGGGTDSLDFSLSAADAETDGFNALTTDNVLKDDDGYSNTTVHGRLGWNISETLRLELVGRDVTGENEYDNCYTPAFAPTNVCSNDYDQTAWRVALSFQSGPFNHELSYNDSETDNQAYSLGAETFGSEGGIERFSYLGNYLAGDAFRVVYGVDLETESIDSDSATRERDQDGYYLEVQGELIDNWFATAGARYDDNDDFGSYTSYRLSTAYLFDFSAGELKLKGSYGTGFRAPSLYEISYNSGPWAYPPASDTALDAEESAGFDLGISWYGNSGLVLEAVYFDQTINDEIYYDLISYSGYLQGDGESESRGVELVAQWPITETLSLSGNYTYNDSEDSEGENRVRRPEHLANLGVNWQPLPALTFGANLRAAQAAEDVYGAELDDYELLDLNASFEILTGLNIYARVENLLDEDYQEVINYNTSGRAAYAGIRYTFQD